MMRKPIPSRRPAFRKPAAPSSRRQGCADAGKDGVERAWQHHIKEHVHAACSKDPAHLKVDLRHHDNARVGVDDNRHKHSHGNDGHARELAGAKPQGEQRYPCDGRNRADHLKQGLENGAEGLVPAMAMPKGTPNGYRKNQGGQHPAHGDPHMIDHGMLGNIAGPDSDQALQGAAGVGSRGLPARRRCPATASKNAMISRHGPKIVKELIEVAALLQPGIFGCLHFLGLHFRAMLSTRLTMPDDTKPKIPMTMMPAMISETSPKERPIWIM